ncbi:hypothetical protein CRN80_12565 [Pseudomonas sp. FDAARGOS_380]|uniref:hypothetical protein n=1 Tax=Pseudomonas sp. FDAARGOS_380 TaxID=2018067 RepID=UPI000BFB451A|nr:hypothetical protein [Pseudomonas sp. FDAARGOS_380]ATN10433.1 hypothetical protein CRN80_12565 [Pseudomonas sp. FDAARGOS_380]
MRIKNRVPDSLKEFLTKESPSNAEGCLEAFDTIATNIFQKLLGDSTYEDLLDQHQKSIILGNFDADKLKTMRQNLSNELDNSILSLTYHSKLALTYRIIAEDYYDAKLHIQTIVELMNANFHLGAAASAYEVTLGKAVILSEKNSNSAKNKNEIFEVSATHFASLIRTHAPNNGWRTKQEAADKLNDLMVNYEKNTLHRTKVKNDITDRLKAWMRERECVKHAIIETLSSSRK